MDYSLRIINRSLVDQRRHHWEATIWILIYLNRIMTSGLSYEKFDFVDEV